MTPKVHFVSAAVCKGLCKHHLAILGRGGDPAMGVDDRQRVASSPKKEACAKGKRLPEHRLAFSKWCFDYLSAKEHVDRCFNFRIHITGYSISCFFFLIYVM